MSLRELAPLFSKGQAPPSTPRLLEVRAVDVHTACGLNKEWHSRMPYIHWSNIVRNKDYICYVAEYDHTAYAAAIWSSPVAANRLTDGEQSLELRRLAISEDAPIGDAIKALSDKLKNDPEYCSTWKANIAMAFKDVISRITEGDEAPRLTLNEAFKVADKAAWEFLEKLKD